ncbi:hypothetical protein [Nonomuraea sp. SYSU D8015]|uniref:hypothetical protein n=1 Tax=Nonomuraea sp. SYSU D8015 TaxID=2593644 RepID=UPI0016602774|nr:hypothetical protein [Nonomuraea sp. SYSU D8015]
MAVTQPRGRTAGTSDGKLPKRLSLDLPMVSIEVRRPEVSLPNIRMPHIGMPHLSRQEVGHYMDVARTFMPPPERIAYYGALGALAVFGVVEWPVAAAIGAGTVIAQRARRQGPSAAGRPRQAATPAQAPEPSRPTTTTTRRRTTATSGAAGEGKTATTSRTAGEGEKTTSGRRATSGAAGTRKTTAGSTGTRTAASGTTRARTAASSTTRKTTTGTTSRRKSATQSR